jgi:hypothetical protein
MNEVHADTSELKGVQYEGVCRLSQTINTSQVQVVVAASLLGLPFSIELHTQPSLSSLQAHLKTHTSPYHHCSSPPTSQAASALAPTMSETIRDIREVRVTRKASTSFNYYSIDLPDIEFPTAGTVVLKFFNILQGGSKPRATNEYWDSLKFTFQGRVHKIEVSPSEPAGVVEGVEFSNTPNSITWKLSAADEGRLSLEYRLCEQPVEFLCVVSLVT